MALEEKFNYDNLEKMIIRLIESKNDFTHYEFYKWIEMHFLLHIRSEAKLTPNLGWLIEYVESLLDDEVDFNKLNDKDKKLFKYKHDILTNIFYQIHKQRLTDNKI